MSLLFSGIFYKLLPTLGRCFSGYNLLFHVVSILATIGFVYFGMDWGYFVFFKERIYLQHIFAPAIYLGFGLPIALPALVFLFGKLGKNLRLVNTAFTLTQAGILGLGISSFYKVFTGRVPPEYIDSLFSPSLPDNMSTVFQFGFGRGGIVYGWPSGHTMVAVAMIVSLLLLHPRNFWLWSAAMAYSVYIAVGMSTNLHWASDIVAGALIGVVIGRAVGKSFQNRFSNASRT